MNTVKRIMEVLSDLEDEESIALLEKIKTRIVKKMILEDVNYTLKLRKAIQQSHIKDRPVKIPDNGPTPVSELLENLEEREE